MGIILPIFALIILALGFTSFFGAPYVPSLKSEIKRAFTDLYKIGKKDLLIDLGAGDGIVQKIAAQYGAKSIGIELNPLIALAAKIRLRKYRDAKIITKNFYDFDFPEETTVVYVFGDSRDIKKITKKIETEAKRLKKSLYVISNGFELPGYKSIKNISSYHLYKIML